MVELLISQATFRHFEDLGLIHPGPMTVGGTTLDSLLVLYHGHWRPGGLKEV